MYSRSYASRNAGLFSKSFNPWPDCWDDSWVWDDCGALCWNMFPKELKRFCIISGFCITEFALDSTPGQLPTLHEEPGCSASHLILPDWTEKTAEKTEKTAEKTEKMSCPLTSTSTIWAAHCLDRSLDPPHRQTKPPESDSTSCRKRRDARTSWCTSCWEPTPSDNLSVTRTHWTHHRLRIDSFCCRKQQWHDLLDTHCCSDSRDSHW